MASLTAKSSATDTWLLSSFFLKNDPSLTLAALNNVHMLFAPAQSFLPTQSLFL